MSKFLIVKKPPLELKDGEYVIPHHSFLPEIRACAKKKPRSNLLSRNYLREILACIAQKYMPDEVFDAVTDVNISRVVDQECGSDEDIDQTILKLLDASFPKLMHKYTAYHFKHRPQRTNFIFYAGPSKYCTSLVELGYQQMLERDYKKELKKESVKPSPATKDLAMVDTLEENFTNV